jgi:FHA domain
MEDTSQRSDLAADSERRLADGETAGWYGTGLPQPTLVVRSGGQLHGRRLELRLGTQALGRDPSCELRIDDGFVSRRHAVVVRDQDAVWLQDAGSANGSSLNGEPLPAGRRRPLRSGDLVRVGRLDLVYLDGTETATRRSTLLRPPAGAPPVEVLHRSGSDDTPPLPPPPVPPAPGPAQPAASPLSPVQLALSATAASVTALVLSRLHVDQLGATAGAALTTLITTVLQAHGRLQWLRVAGGAGLALALAVTGITVPELALGRSLANPDRPATFVPAQLTPQPRAARRSEPRVAPGIAATPDPVACDTTAPGGQLACPPVTIQSTGSAPLRVVSLELTGPAAGDFQVDGADCQDRRLARGESCTIQVLFQPTQDGARSATLVVHQNLPRPDTGTPVGLTGNGLSEPTTTTQP